jgi:hypothetical protein
MKRPSFIYQTLRELSKDLDETYERMLTQIDTKFHNIALRALRWLAFAVKPIAVAELNEACLIDPEGKDGTAFDAESRGPFEVLLDVLGSLVLVERSHHWLDDVSTQGIDQHRVEGERAVLPIKGSMIVRLANFSVQEFLVTPQILRTAAHQYALRSEHDRHLLLKSNVAYIEYCMCILQKHMKTSDCHILVINEEALQRVLQEFTFMEYVCYPWHRYTLSVSAGDTRQVMRALDHELFMRVHEFTIASESAPDDRRAPPRVLRYWNGGGPEPLSFKVWARRSPNSTPSL